MRALVVVSLFAASFCLSALAQDTPMRVNVDVEDADLAEVMEAIGEQVGRNVLVDPDVQERVTVSLRDIAWREAVDVLAKMTHCEVTDKPGGWLLVEQPTRITLELEQAPAAQALDTITRLAGQGLLLFPELEQVPVTLNLEAVRWEQALAQVLEQIGAEHIDLHGTITVGPRPLPAWFRDHARTETDWEALARGKRINVHVEDVSLAQVCDRIGILADRTIVLDSGVDEVMTVSLTDLPWREALEVVAQMAGCRVEPGPGDALVLTQDPHLTVQFVDTEASTILSLAAQYAGFSLVLTPGAQARRLTVNALEVPGHLAIPAIARVVGLEAALVDRVWLVGPNLPNPEALSPPPPPSGGDPLTLELQTLDVREWVDLIAAEAEAEIRVRASAPQPLTLGLRGMPWRDAVSLIARLTGWRLREHAGGLLSLTQPPQVEVLAHDAPLRVLLPLVAEYTGRELVVSNEGVSGRATLYTRHLPWLTALRFTAEAHGYPLGRDAKSGTLRLGSRRADAPQETGEPLPLIGEADPAPAAASDAPVNTGAPEADRQALRTRLDALFATIVQLADARAHDALVERFTELRHLLEESGELGLQEAHQALTRWRPKLQALGEVSLSIQFQLDMVEGNLLLEQMQDEIREQRSEAVAETRRAARRLVERMRGQERDVFARNADALELRFASLATRAKRLAQLQALPLEISALVVVPDGAQPASAAIINGHVVRLGDPVPGPDGVPLEGVRLRGVTNWGAKLERKGTRFVREIRSR